jgi:hypothetical protein
MNVFCALDIIESILSKKLLDQNNQAISSHIGFLTSVYLSENEYDIYGFITVSKIKVVLIVT